MSAASPCYDVYAVAYGTRSTRASEVFLNFATYNEADRPMQMDYFFWVAVSPKLTILVDTGFSPDEGARRGRQMFAPVGESLGVLGIRPEAVDLILLTHAHYDHIGGLPDLPAGEVVLSEREYSFWQSPMARRQQFAHPVCAEELELLARLKGDGRLVLFGDRLTPAPGVEVIEVGGHTPGQSVVSVATATGPVILASDALHYYEELELDRPFNVVADLEAMYAGFDRLRELSALPGARLVAGHDPAVGTRFPKRAGDDRVIQLS